MAASVGRRRTRTVGCLVLAFVLLAVGAVVAIRLLQTSGVADPLPGEQRCVAKAGDHAVALDVDQAHYASIIVGIAVKRGLPARAGSIAIATVYQETGIRNLDYGDRDSVGLFQQRRSQGWGSTEELMDPYYATGKFYDALIKIDGWQTADINDVAQQVQISGEPEAYRQHEANGRTIASSLSGHSPASFTCLERESSPGDPDGLVDSLKETFGKIRSTTKGKTVTIKIKKDRLAWAYAHYALANSAKFGVTSVTLGDRHWQGQEMKLPSWTTADPAGKENRVVITLR